LTQADDFKLAGTFQVEEPELGKVIVAPALMAATSPAPLAPCPFAQDASQPPLVSIHFIEHSCAHMFEPSAVRQPACSFKIMLATN
jgi:hypothetical protein